jgi:hypothetical protein
MDYDFSPTQLRDIPSVTTYKLEKGGRAKIMNTETSVELLLHI